MFLYVNGLQALNTEPLPPSKSTFYYTPENHAPQLLPESFIFP
jgi:hypothetical protein